MENDIFTFSDIQRKFIYYILHVVHTKCERESILFQLTDKEVTSTLSILLLMLDKVGLGGSNTSNRNLEGGS